MTDYWMNKAAKSLTSTLYRLEADAQPLTLNSIIASIILYRRDMKALPIDEIVEDADFIFNYFKTKLSQTTMTVSPSQVLIETHIDALGFEMQNRGKKNCVVVLEPKISKM